MKSISWWGTVALGIICLVGVSIFVYLNFNKSNNPQISTNSRTSHKIYGDVTSIDNNMIAVFGVHVYDGINKDVDYLKNKRPMTIKITPDTKFTRNVWRVSITDKSGQLDPAKKIVETGSLEDLTNGLHIVINTADDTLGLDQVTASEINYTKVITQ